MRLISRKLKRGSITLLFPVIILLIIVTVYITPKKEIPHELQIQQRDLKEEPITQIDDKAATLPSVVQPQLTTSPTISPTPRVENQHTLFDHSFLIPLEKVLSNTVVGVKSFGRANKIGNLLISLKKYYPDLKIIIMDDGKSSLADGLNVYLTELIEKEVKAIQENLNNKINLPEEKDPFLVSSPSLELQFFEDSDVVPTHDQIDEMISSTFQKTLHGAKIYQYPYDQGLAFGRNVLIDVIETPYFVYVDDDFVFVDNTSIPYLITILDKTEIDLVGGFVKDRPDYLGFSLQFNDTQIKQNQTHQGMIYDCHIFDIVPNFFAAKVNRLRLVGWDNHFKIGEHEDFFVRAKGLLTIASCPFAAIEHNTNEDWLRLPEDKLDEYAKNRKRVFKYLNDFLFKHDLSVYLSYANHPLARRKDTISLYETQYNQVMETHLATVVLVYRGNKEYIQNQLCFIAKKYNFVRQIIIWNPKNDIILKNSDFQCLSLLTKTLIYFNDLEFSNNLLQESKVEKELKQLMTLMEIEMDEKVIPQELISKYQLILPLETSKIEQIQNEEVNSTITPPLSIQIINSQGYENEAGRARYRGCAVGNYPVCIFIDDNFVPLYFQQLYDNYLRFPNLLHTCSDSKLYWNNLKSTFIQDEIGIETGFSLIGTGALISKQKVIDFLEFHGNFKNEDLPSNSDYFFSLWLNSLPYQLQVNLFSYDVNEKSSDSTSAIDFDELFFSQQFILMELKKIFQYQPFSSPPPRKRANEIGTHVNYHFFTKAVGGDGKIFITNMDNFIPGSNLENRKPYNFRNLYKSLQWIGDNSDILDSTMEENQKIDFFLQHQYLFAIDSKKQTSWISTRNVQFGDWIGFGLPNFDYLRTLEIRTTPMDIKMEIELSLDGFHWSPVFGNFNLTTSFEDISTSLNNNKILQQVTRFSLMRDLKFPFKYCRIIFPKEDKNIFDNLLYIYDLSSPISSSSSSLSVKNTQQPQQPTFQSPITLYEISFNN